MNNKAFTLSLAMAFIAFFFVSSYVSSIEEEANKKYGTKLLVMTAKVDVKEMETLNETMLDQLEVPRRSKSQRAVVCDHKPGTDQLSPEERRDCVKRLVGTVAIVPIKKGEQISSTR